MRRTGLALSEGSVAVPLDTLTRERKLSDRIRRILRIGAQHQVDCFVVGLPLQTNGQVGERAELAQAFAARLGDRTELPIHLVDERYTTVEAEQRLRSTGMSSQRIAEVIDQASAVVILESWIAQRSEA